MIQLQLEPYMAFRDQPGWNLDGWSQATRPFSDIATRQTQAHVYKITEAGRVASSTIPYEWHELTWGQYARACAYSFEQMLKLMRFLKERSASPEPSPPGKP